MYKYLAIVFSPLLAILHKNARARNVAEKILRLFPWLKPFLARLLYGKAVRFPHGPSLKTGPQQQRIYEEIKRRLKAEVK